MRLGRIENKPEAIKELLVRFEDVFVEFDRDFINVAYGCLYWDVQTFIPVNDIEKFLRKLAKQKDLWDLGSITILNDGILFRCVEDVAYVGDDVWAMYQTPVVKHYYPRYWFDVAKYVRQPADTYPMIELFIKGWGSWATVEFKALGKGRLKYLGLVREVFGK